VPDTFIPFTIVIIAIIIIIITSEKITRKFHWSFGCWVSKRINEEVERLTPQASLTLSSLHQH